MKSYISIGVLLLALLLGHQVSTTLSLLGTSVDWPSAKPSDEDRMTALVYREHGGVDVLELVNDMPRPIPQDNQVLVHVQASALNPIDFKLRRNPVPNFLVGKPKITGMDLAGVVVATGKDVAVEFQVGDRVAAMLPMLGSQWGAAAEYVAVRPAHLAKIPDGVRYEDAASLPLAGLTAIQKLRNLSSPRARKS